MEICTVDSSCADHCLPLLNFGTRTAALMQDSGAHSVALALSCESGNAALAKAALVTAVAVGYMRLPRVPDPLIQANLLHACKQRQLWPQLKRSGGAGAFLASWTLSFKLICCMLAGRGGFGDSGSSGSAGSLSAYLASAFPDASRERSRTSRSR
eukprot:scaffold152173_cov19-Tisochrysis_lutea.AAC.1